MCDSWRHRERFGDDLLQRVCQAVSVKTGKVVCILISIAGGTLPTSRALEEGMYSSSSVVSSVPAACSPGMNCCCVLELVLFEIFENAILFASLLSEEIRHRMRLK